MFCRNCGKEMENNSSFCIHCGEKQRAPDTPVNLNENEQKRLRYKKYGTYMLFFALVCFFTAMGLKNNAEAQGFVGFLMVIVGGAGLIVYFTNR